MDSQEETSNFEASKYDAYRRQAKMTVYLLLSIVPIGLIVYAFTSPLTRSFIFRYAKEEAKVRSGEARINTEGSKIYTNTKYGYSIKYPASFDYKQIFEEKYPDPATAPLIVISDKNSFMYITIDAGYGYGKDKSISFDAKVEQRVKEYNSLNPDNEPLTVIKKLLINNNPAAFISDNSSSSPRLEAIIESKNKEIVWITLSPVFQGSEQAYTNAFYELVSTFEFNN